MELEISDQSEITEIREGDFHGFSNLSTLRLSSNGIYRLHVDSFIEVIDLTTLSLDDNNLTNIPDHVFYSTTKLKTLDLSRNSLLRVPRSVDALKHLQELDLSFNQISDTVDLDFISGMTNLHILSLQGNLISTVDSDAVEELFNSSLYEVKLCSNPFLCDNRLCSLMFWYDLLLFSSPNWNLLPIFGQETCEYTCSSPWEYYRKPLKSAYYDVCLNVDIGFDTNFSTTQVNIPLLLKNNKKRMHAIGGGIGALAFAAVIFGVVVFIRLRRFRLMRGGFIFAGRGLLRPNRIYGQEQDLVYDALVYHHNEEVEFVDDRLRPRLENHPNNLRLCLPLIRDFRLGAKRLNSLRESLVASRCAVFVISEAFVLDARCRQALEVACDYLHRDDLGPPHIKQTGLILILLDPVLLETLPEAIRVLVDRLITLEWNNLDEERCWRRLEQSLHDFVRQEENEV
ncbi:toll-like receptor 2 [Diadema setosum]|uniref:toll-like receptor 2 n=1 Tax=Diadema setosum TaxID=31175 RepID=UPI003B3A500D